MTAMLLLAFARRSPKAAREGPPPKQ
jgi:hypothetical protein